MENREPIRVTIQEEKKKSEYSRYKEEFIRGVIVGFDLIETLGKKYEEGVEEICKKVGRR